LFFQEIPVVVRRRMRRRKMMKQFFDKDRDDGTILSETHTYMF